MAYRQDGPVPEQVRFTLRVDSETHPVLAELLWTMPWGARHAAVLELLELGYRAKQGGLTLPSAPLPNPRASATQPGEPAAVPPARAPASKSARPAPAPRAAAHFPPPAPATAHAPTPAAAPGIPAPPSPPGDLPAAPPATNTATPADPAIDTPGADQEVPNPDEPSAISLLLGQFGG